MRIKDLYGNIEIEVAYDVELALRDSHPVAEKLDDRMDHPGFAGDRGLACGYPDLFWLHQGAPHYSALRPMATRTETAAVEAQNGCIADTYRL